jgi:hypothetical protein
MSLMLSWLGQLLELSKSKDRGDGTKEVCKALRGIGFSNNELSSFSRAR